MFAISIHKPSFQPNLQNLYEIIYIFYIKADYTED